MITFKPKWPDIVEKYAPIVQRHKNEAGDLVAIQPKPKTLISRVCPVCQCNIGSDTCRMPC